MKGSQVAEFEKALAAALRYLAVRDRTQHEMARYLITKGFSHRAAERVLQKLLGWGYLDDARVAFQWARAKAERDLWGPTRVAAELHRRGIQRETISDIITKLDTELPEWELACSAARRYLRSHPHRGLLLSRRLAAYLGRRGFSPAVIREVLRRELPEETSRD